MKKKKKAISKKKRIISTKAKMLKQIGKITHFYGGLKVAIVKFNKAVKRGTQAHIKGATTDFKQILDSMQYNHKPISTAPKGKLIGIKIKKRVREGDEVFEIK